MILIYKDKLPKKANQVPRDVSFGVPQERSCHIRAKCQQLGSCLADETKTICTTSTVSGNIECSTTTYSYIQ